MRKTINNSDVFQAMEEWAPSDLAYDWDNIGLQIGSYSQVVKKAMITLDVLESVVDEAIENNVDLIIAHHPLLFKSIKQIDIDTPQGKISEKLLKHNITVYAAHTNLDVAIGGVNDILCDLLEVESRKHLIKMKTEILYKVVVYVPATHLKAVRNALSAGGAGHIGNYSHCTFQTEGQGTFKPLTGAHPYIGEKDQLALVDEVKIETIASENNLSTIIKKMKKAHPYEEVAYDILPLVNKGESLGIGRIGLLKNDMSLQELAEHVKDVFDLPHLRVTGDLKGSVKRIAVLGGSGGKYIHQAKEMGADVYITGDMTFHVAQEAEEVGLSVIDAGHYIEKVMKEVTKNVLKQQFDATDLEIIVSNVNTDPFKFI